MKKITIALMAALLTLSLVGCSSKKEPTVVEEVPREQSEKEIRATIDEFFASLAAGEYEKLEDFVAFEDFDNAFSADDLMDSFGDAVVITDPEVKEQLQKDLANLMKSTSVKIILGYEIENIIIDGDSAAVEGALTMLDFGKAADFEGLFTEEEILGISMQNLSSVLLMTSDDDKEKAEGLMGLVNAILDEMIEKLKELDSIDTQTTIPLERVNGKWEFKK